MKFDEKNVSYELRQIVAKLQRVGHTRQGRLVTPVFRYLTFWSGKGIPCFAAELVRQANAERDVLVTENLQEGDIVISPGLVYRKIPMTGMIMNAHLQAMRTFKPKPHFVYEKSKEQAIDLGATFITEN